MSQNSLYPKEKCLINLPPPPKLPWHSFENAEPKRPPFSSPGAHQRPLGNGHVSTTRCVLWSTKRRSLPPSLVWDKIHKICRTRSVATLRLFIWRQRERAEVETKIGKSHSYTSCTELFVWNLAEKSNAHFCRDVPPFSLKILRGVTWFYSHRDYSFLQAKLWRKLFVKMTSPSKNVALSLIHSLFGKLFLIQFLPVPASYPLLLPSRRQNISPDSFDESGVFNKGKCICLLKY